MGGERSHDNQTSGVCLDAFHSRQRTGVTIETAATGGIWRLGANVCKANLTYSPMHTITGRAAAAGGTLAHGKHQKLGWAGISMATRGCSGDSGWGGGYMDSCQLACPNPGLRNRGKFFMKHTNYNLKSFRAK